MCDAYGTQTLFAKVEVVWYGRELAVAIAGVKEMHKRGLRAAGSAPSTSVSTETTCLHSTPKLGSKDGLLRKLIATGSGFPKERVRGRHLP
jgi:hypothetical protein